MPARDPARRPLTRALLLATALPVLAWSAGCGSEEPAAPPSSPAPAVEETAATETDDPARSPACRAVSRRAVERAVVVAGGPARALERTANDSLDLSICAFRERSGPDVYVSVTVDTAPETARRYYILIAEARQRATFTAIPDSTRPVGVRGVGNDHTHGGVGAYWTRYRSQLTAIDDRTLVKVGFHVPGASQDAARAQATELARQVLP